MLHLILAIAAVILFPKLTADETLGFSNSFFSVLLFTALYVVLEKGTGDRRMSTYTHWLGLLFAFFTACGHALDTYGSISFRQVFLPILIYTHVFACLLNLLWTILTRIDPEVKTKEISERKENRCASVIRSITSRPVIVFVILLLAWIPVFIANYPGGFLYDAGRELAQIENGFSGDFPLLHSMIITKLLPFFYKLSGSYNTGIAVYVIAQMILLAVIYTHMITVFSKRKIHAGILVIITLYCGFFPVIQLLVVQVVRDVLFSVLLAYSMFYLYLMMEDRDAFWESKKNPILFGVVLTLTFLARNNNTGMAAPVFLIIMGGIICFVNRKKYLKGALIFSMTSIVSYAVLTLMLIALCQPLTKAASGSSLSIMSQSLARAYLYESDKWTEEDSNKLMEYMNVEELAYYPENADSTKNRVHIPEGKQIGFFIFWLKMGIKHPGCYADAILAGTQNMWYPDTVVDGYNQRYTNPGEPYSTWDKCYYYMESWIEEPGVHRNLLPKVLEFYTNIGLRISFEKIPVVSMLFSIGFNFWLVLNCLFYVLHRKITKLLPAISLLLVYVMISAFVPLILLRYFAALFLAMPMIIVFTLQPSGSCSDFR